MEAEEVGNGGYQLQSQRRRWVERVMTSFPAMYWTAWVRGISMFPSPLRIPYLAHAVMQYVGSLGLKVGLVDESSREA